MNRRNAAGHEEIFQVHQTSDGQPTLDSRRRIGDGSSSAGFQSANPKIEGAPKPNIEKEEHRLVATANQLRVVAARVPN